MLEGVLGMDMVDAEGRGEWDRWMSIRRWLSLRSVARTLIYRFGE